MLNDFFNKFMEIVNTIDEGVQVYFEKAPTEATYPYGLIQDYVSSPLDYGELCAFDIIFNADESNASDIEEIIDKFKNFLDGYSYSDNKTNFHIGFETNSLNFLTNFKIMVRRDCVIF